MKIFIYICKPKNCTNNNLNMFVIDTLGFITIDSFQYFLSSENLLL